jgi:hypothetical protein
MRSKFAAAQSGLRIWKRGDILLFSANWEKRRMSPLFPQASSSWSAFRAPDPVIESMTLRPVPA